MSGYRHHVEQMYSPAEAAKLLGVGRSMLFELLRRGQRSQGSDGIHPVYRLGRRCTRIPATAINRFLERRCV